jgi:hypothetical protein
MSTGGAATKAMMYTDTAVNSVGIIITRTLHRRFSVEVTHSQKRAHKEEALRRSRIAVMYVFIKFFLKIKFSQINIILLGNNSIHKI